MKNGKKLLLTYSVATLVTGLLTTPAFAVVEDKYVDGARMCTQYFPRQERKLGIPLHLLAAVASTESGRWHDGLKMSLPWPWTVNANGKGYYLDSKQEAIALVRKLQSQGTKSIDVGCMQVNLYHHSDAFGSLSQAFDPEYNVAYAAKFLRNNYADTRSWLQATAAYHSRTPKHGARYITAIEKNWNNIVRKVREARLNRGISTEGVGAPGTMVKEFAAQDKITGGATYVEPQRTRALPASYQVDEDTALNAPEEKRRVRMKIIQVRDKNASARESGVLIIKPTNKDTPATDKRAAVKEEQLLTPAQKLAAATPPEAITTITPASADKPANVDLGAATKAAAMATVSGVAASSASAQQGIIAAPNASTQIAAAAAASAASTVAGKMADATISALTGTQNPADALPASLPFAKLSDASGAQHALGAKPKSAFVFQD